MHHNEVILSQTKTPPSNDPRPGNIYGRILRVKTGYNPNSSSVGSGIPTFLFSMVGTGIFSVVAATLFEPVRARLLRRGPRPDVAGDVAVDTAVEDGAGGES